MILVAERSAVRWLGATQQRATEVLDYHAHGAPRGSAAGIRTAAEEFSGTTFSNVGTIFEI